MTDAPLTPHAQHNREMWDRAADSYQESHGPQLDKAGRSAWGVWQLPESELQILGDVAELDVLEFGCGAAQWSIELHRRGARVTGLDNSARQLKHARELMAAAGVEFSLVHGSAESTPFASRSFDVVFCDHGAMTFCDPYLTVPETARLLRPGGLLAFSMNTPIYDLCWDPEAGEQTERLVADYWDLHVLEEPGEATNFQLPYGEWVRLFTDSGFTVESLIELRPAADAVSSYRDAAERAWARRWPMEHIWRARRRGDTG
jgi:SAM-dependent methyltransferase